MHRSRRLLLIIVAAAFFLPACGKKTTPTTNISGSTTYAPYVPPVTPPPTPPTPPTPATDGCKAPGAGGSSPLSYEITRYGGSASFTTGSITTDNCLRIRYEAGPAGNQVFDATDVRVEITVNGSTRVPKYTLDPACPAGGCEYGRPSDGPSTAMNFSGSLSPGVPVTITVAQARYNWYCYTGLYPGQIPAYNPYEGCNYRLVLDPFNNGSQSSIGHYWKGRLIVATSATDINQFNSNNP